MPTSPGIIEWSARSMICASAGGFSLATVMAAILPSDTTTVWSSFGCAPLPSISFTCTSATFGDETFTSSLTSLASLSYCCAAQIVPNNKTMTRFFIAHLKAQQHNRGAAADDSMSRYDDSQDSGLS